MARGLTAKELMKTLGKKSSIRHVYVTEELSRPISISLKGAEIELAEHTESKGVENQPTGPNHPELQNF